ncbi:GbsR/MarR family transcriptional regulator [Nonomuraea sp. SYSU D8015]|uniref:GbsR/MarR family transcriptional regulator n=1 Tax=Nonomuraea sp. SYSU D8015 TaxID=2593644 RepID=UPI0016608A5D|nr:transcriptional regulator [Nonomuraea sp. SYSU D8015]
MADPDDQELLAYVEDVAGLFARDGLPLITGRIIGWLMVCDPPEQSAQQIGQAIQASKASLSTNMRVLTESGFVRTITRPGDRVTYYRIDDDAWLQITRRRLAALSGFRDVTAKGLRLLGEDSPRARRVRDAHEMFSWLDRELTPLWDRWAEMRHKEKEP